MMLAARPLGSTRTLLHGDTVLLAGLALATLLGMLGAYALSPFLPLIAVDLDSKVGLLGQSMALLNLLAAGLGLVIGALADRAGPRRLLLLGLAAVAAGALVAATATSVAVLLAAAIVGALGRGSVQPLAFIIAASRFQGEAQRRAISLVQAGASACALVGLPALAGAGELVGWRGALAALAVLVLAIVLLQGRVLPPDGAREPQAGTLADALRAYAPLVRHRPTLGLVGATLVGGCGFLAALAYGGAFLVQVHGLSVAQAGVAYLAGGLGQLAGNLLAGGRLGRRPLRPLLIGLRLAQAPLLAGMLLLPDAGVVVVLALMLLAGLLHGASTPLGMTLLVAESPAGRAVSVALYQAALTLGVAAASGLGGLLLALGGYAALGVGMVIACGVSALLLWLSRPPAGIRAPVAAGCRGGEAPS